MEARQKRQDAINERIQEEQQQEEEEDDQEQQQEEEEATHQDEAEGETTVEDQPSNPARKSGDENSTEESTEKAKPTVPEVEHRKPPPRTNNYLGLDQQLMLGKPASPRKIPILPPFPAFFRVVRRTGADVYRDEGEELTAFLVTRVVPCGVVFLGTAMEWRTCVLDHKMMIRMPDGWVDEVAVQRIDTVRFPSSPTH